MKALFPLFLLFGFTFINAQVPFEKDGRWGLSKNGSTTDSIIFRANFDKIEAYSSSLVGTVYTGLKNDEWQMLSSNKLVNQQRYEELELVPFNDALMVGSREGYIDIINLILMDFSIRGVRADNLVDGSSSLRKDSTLLMTKKGKDMVGLINSQTGKEVLRAEYENLRANGSDNGNVAFLAYKDEENFAFDETGELLFSLRADIFVTQMKSAQGISDCYIVEVVSKKGTEFGFYDAINKWLIPPIYMAVQPMDHTSDAIIVTTEKGQGLYFQGKALLEAEYMSIEKSDKRGFVAFCHTKKGKFYVTPEGIFVQGEK